MMLSLLYLRLSYFTPLLSLQLKVDHETTGQHEEEYDGRSHFLESILTHDVGMNVEESQEDEDDIGNLLNTTWNDSQSQSTHNLQPSNHEAIVFRVDFDVQH